MTIIDRIACLIGNIVTAAACVLLTILYFEGLPIIRQIPFVGAIPVLGQIARGEIAVRVDAALGGYVLRSEKTALEAQLARERELRARDEAAIATYRKRASEDARAKDEADAKIRKTEAEDTGDDGPRWGRDDLEWLSKH